MPVAPITAVVVVDFSGQPTGQPIVLASAVARNFIFGQWDLAPFFAGAGPEKNIVGFTPSTSEAAPLTAEVVAGLVGDVAVG